MYLVLALVLLYLSTIFQVKEKHDCLCISLHLGIRLYYLRNDFRFCEHMVLEGRLRSINSRRRSRRELIFVFARQHYVLVAIIQSREELFRF